jgi:hypothetical protein
LIVFINHLANLSSIGKKIIDEKNIFYNVYPSTHFAVDFVPLSVLYSIENNLGNAIFLKFYPLFAYFFGQKGVFTNSPFLLFSFFGLKKVKRKLRVKLVLLLLLLAFFYVYINPDYEGGYTPRYVRHAEPFILIFSIFLVKYLSKEKSKLFTLVFVTFSAISITNCFSLSIRTDWNYEKITDLISSDIVLWPLIPVKQENITLDLTKVSEQEKWNLTSEEGCNLPLKTPLGLQLGPCACTYLGFAEREVEIPKDFNVLKVRACTTSSGNDGIMLYVELGNKTFPLFFKPSKCEDIYLNISEYAGKKVRIKFYADVYGYCYDEFIYLKEISFLPLNQTKFSTYEKPKYNLIGEKRKWILYGSKECLPLFLKDSLFLDKCFCSYDSYATRVFPERMHEIYLQVCPLPYNEDGSLLKIFIDNDEKFEFIPPNDCKSINLKSEKGFVNLTLSVDVYGRCYSEGLLIKELYVS